MPAYKESAVEKTRDYGIRFRLLSRVSDVNRAIHQKIIKLARPEDAQLLNQHLTPPLCQVLFGVWTQCVIHTFLFPYNHLAGLKVKNIVRGAAVLWSSGPAEVTDLR